MPWTNKSQKVFGKMQRKTVFKKWSKHSKIIPILDFGNWTVDLLIVEDILFLLFIYWELKIFYSGCGPNWYGFWTFVSQLNQ